MARKPARSQRRAERYQDRKAAARTSREHMVVAWEWMLAELTALAAKDPGKADAACRHMASQIEAIAADTARAVNRADESVR